jgi:predicted restriction endonuclease
MPLKFLLNILDNDNSISLREFDALVDGNTNRVSINTSYWKKDLINCGFLRQANERLFYTGKYSQFINEIKVFSPNPLLTDADWQEIRDNPLIEISPFKNSLMEIFENITRQQSIEEQITDGIFTAPLIDVISEQEELSIPEIDILSTDVRFSQSTRRVRNTTWSIRIKKKYSYLCAVPECDVNGNIFVEATHIKPDNVYEDLLPHRTHILNGLCLCRHCHIAFDKGYFSLTDDHKIISSPKFDNIANQHIKAVILSSVNKQIKQRKDNQFPLVEFIQYHRNNLFKR